MKNWMKRFGMLAALGVIAGSAFVAGCGGAPDEEAAPANATEAPAPDAEPAGDGS